MTTVMSAAADLLRSHTIEDYEGDREFTAEHRMASSQAPPRYESRGVGQNLMDSVLPEGDVVDLSATVVPSFGRE